MDGVSRRKHDGQLAAAVSRHGADRRNPDIAVRRLPVRADGAGALHPASVPVAARDQRLSRRRDGRARFRLPDVQPPRARRTTRDARPELPEDRVQRRGIGPLRHARGIRAALRAHGLRFRALQAVLRSCRMHAARRGAQRAAAAAHGVRRSGGAAAAEGRDPARVRGARAATGRTRRRARARERRRDDRRAAGGRARPEYERALRGRRNRRDLRGGPERRARLLAAVRTDARDVPARHRRRDRAGIRRHGRPRLPPSRRPVRDRPPEGHDHHRGAQLLLGGYRVRGDRQSARTGAERLRGIHRRRG